MLGGTSTVSDMAERFSAGRRLTTICSVDSARSNRRRSVWLLSTATCLNDWIRSAARLRLATSCLAASLLPAMNSSSFDRRTCPSRTSSAKCSQRRAKLDATVRLMPTGLFTSCATPATRPPSAASFSASIRLFWVSCSSRSAFSARSFEALSSFSAASLAMAFWRNTSTARAMAPISSRAPTSCTGRA